MDEEIAVGVRRRQVAVVDLLAREFHRAIPRESSLSAARLKAEGHAALHANRVVHGVAQQLLRPFVREDDVAAAAHGFVDTGMLGMPGVLLSVWMRLAPVAPLTAANDEPGWTGKVPPVI